MKNNMMFPEGYKPALISFILSLFSFIFICNTLSLIFLLLTLFIVYIYRDADKYIFENENNVISPISGKVIAIDKNENKIDIYCEVRLCDSSEVRASSTGVVTNIAYKNGLNLQPMSKKGKLLNSQISFELNNVKFDFISGFFNTKIFSNFKKEVKQGDILGLFINGVVKISIDSKYETSLKIGNKLVSGQTLIYRKSSN